MDVSALEQMTLKELKQLRDKIDVAIRAAIRQSRSSVTNTDQAAGQTPPPKFDLEAERDAWKARRAASGTSL